MKYLLWLLLIPLGVIQILIEFNTPDIVSDSLLTLLSDNVTTSFVGIKPLLTLTLLLWQVSGMVSCIMGVVFTWIGYRRSQGM